MDFNYRWGTRKVLFYALILTFVMGAIPLYPYVNATASDFKYEAASAEVEGAAQFLTTTAGGDIQYVGNGYISFFTGDSGAATFHVQAAATGLYKLNIGYYSPYGRKVTSLLVNGQSNGEIELPVIAEAGSVSSEASAGKIMLKQGDNTIRFERGWGYYGIEYISLESADTVIVPDTSQYEAEAGILAGGAEIRSTGNGYSGDGYVFIPGGSVELNVSAPAEGFYTLDFGYRASYGFKKTLITVNKNEAGASGFEVDLNESAEFVEISAGKVFLNAGNNTITFDANWSWYDIDYIKLTPMPIENKEHQVPKSLINPNATREARALMNYLVDNYGKNIISGQQELSDAEWIYEKTGKHPAMVSFDLIDYSPTRVAHGTKSEETEKMMQWAERGGIVSLCWHWNSPNGLIDVPGKEWWRAFYTDSTTFDVEYALSHPDSEEYKLLLSDIDVIAIQLKRLQDANIPVLWRPLHEAEGGWFWWGAKGPESAKQLYRLMYERLTNEHQLNNLIWVWNSVSSDWYPGDDVVDIISTDIYNQAGDYSPNINKYDRLVEVVKDRKLVSLPETGTIPDPDLLPLYGADWSWFSTWTGDFIRNGIYNTAEHLTHVFNHEYVITLDELPSNLSTYGLKAPEWINAELQAANVNQTSATLSWSGASSEQEIINYLIYKDGIQLDEVNGSSSSYEVSGLAAGTKYTFKVEAATRDGVWSVGGPQIEVTTLSEPIVTPSNPDTSQPPAAGPGGKQTIQLNSAEFEAAVAKAQKGTILVNGTPAAGAKEVKVNIPAEQIAKAIDKGLERIEVNIGYAAITISLSEISSHLSGTSATITFTFSIVDPSQMSDLAKSKLGGAQVYDLNLDIDGKKITTFHAASLKVALNYSLAMGANPNTIVTYHIKENGELEVVKNSYYDATTKKVIFHPTHFSQYAAAAVDVSFKDKGSSTASQDAIDYLAARGIVQGKGNGLFKPLDLVTRAEFVQIIIQAFDLNDDTASNTFNDVPSEGWYTKAVSTAQQLGLIKGKENGSFGPREAMTKQDAAAVLERVAKLIGSTAFKSNDSILAKSVVNREQAAEMVSNLMRFLD